MLFAPPIEILATCLNRPDRIGQTESARPNRPVRIDQTETAQTEMARPNRPDWNSQTEKSCSVRG